MLGSSTLVPISTHTRALFRSLSLNLQVNRTTRRIILSPSLSPVSNKSLDDFKVSTHIFTCQRASVVVECAYLYWEKLLKQYGAQ